MSRANKPADLSLDDLDRQIAELQTRRNAALALAGKTSATADPADAAAPAARTTKRRAGPAAPVLQTGGGAVFNQSVSTTSGHIIGRDFVQIVERMTVQGEDPAHATQALASYLHALSVDLAGLRLDAIDAIRSRVGIDRARD